MLNLDEGRLDLALSVVLVHVFFEAVWGFCPLLPAGRIAADLVTEHLQGVGFFVALLDGSDAGCFGFRATHRVQQRNYLVSAVAHLLIVLLVSTVEAEVVLRIALGYWASVLLSCRDFSIWWIKLLKMISFDRAIILDVCDELALIGSS